MTTKPGTAGTLERIIHWAITGLKIAMTSLVAVMALGFVASMTGLPDPVPDTVETMFGLYESILIMCLVAVVYASPVVTVNAIKWAAGRWLPKRSGAAVPAAVPRPEDRREDLNVAKSG